MAVRRACGPCRIGWRQFGRPGWRRQVLVGLFFKQAALQRGRDVVGGRAGRRGQQAEAASSRHVWSAGRVAQICNLLYRGCEIIVIFITNLFHSFRTQIDGFPPVNCHPFVKSSLAYAAHLTPLTDATVFRCFRRGNSGQKLHLRPGSIDQNRIHIGPTPDQYRTYTVAPRLGVAGGSRILILSIGSVEEGF